MKTCSARPLEVDLRHVAARARAEQLRMGGRNPRGQTIGATCDYLTKDGEPWLPVMGEVHYSRLPRAEWEEALLKMKAGGVEIVASYTFWIHHEELRGEWEWTGNKDVRSFIELCGRFGMYFFARIGPWAHGEVRNGGFPDWLPSRCGGKVRCDAEPYLAEVRRLYEAIFEQMHGLQWKDGGPMIGLQIENELVDNAAHIRTLKRLANEIGFDVPLYTATAWMHAELPSEEVLPMSGGYADAFWAGQTETWDRRARQQYFFTHERDDASIGIDVTGGRTGRGSSRTADHPYLACELGGGMMTSYARRPIIGGDDTGALAMVKLGSGANLLGYYMYHGGANPPGKRCTLQESKRTGYPNDLPVVSYDFQAPLRQYGQPGPAYGILRTLHHFLSAWGRDMATMPATLPAVLPRDADDTQTLRWSVRSDGRRGFLFVNNYQREEGLGPKRGVQFELELADEVLRVPRYPVDVPAQAYFFWPFRMDLGGAELVYATAQPLGRVGETFVFSAIEGMGAEFVFASDVALPERGSRRGNAVTLDPEELLDLRGPGGCSARVLLLSAAQARHAAIARVWGADRIFLGPGTFLFDGDSVRVQFSGEGAQDFLVYPPPADHAPGRVGPFARLSFDGAPARAIGFRLVRPAGRVPQAETDGKGQAIVPEDGAFDGAAVYALEISPDILDGLHDAVLELDYVGDIARAYIGGDLVDDNFFSGAKWEIGLRRLMPRVAAEGLTIKILPLRRGAPIYIARPQESRGGACLSAVRVRCIKELRVETPGAG